MSRRKAIKEYRQNFPYYWDGVRDGAFGGYGTHLETLGGQFMSAIMNELVYHADSSKLTTGVQSHVEFSKSVFYSFLAGASALPCAAEMAIETPIRKLTGRTGFK
jgi:hypothetical protein